MASTIKCRTCQERKPVPEGGHAYSKQCNDCNIILQTRKKCTKCQQVLSADSFSKTSEGILLAYCKLCKSTVKDGKKCMHCNKKLDISNFENSFSKKCFDCKERSKVEKKCSYCHEVKSVDEFAYSKTQYRQGYCKVCQAKLSPMYEERRTRESKRVSHRRLYEKRKNDEKYKLYMQEYREQNKERIKELNKEWHKKNKSYTLASRNNNRSKNKGVPGYIKSRDWKFMLNLVGGLCIGCDEACDELTLDHVISFNHGGLNVIENVQPLCLRCNIKKGTKSGLDFRTEEFNRAIRENCTLECMAR